MKSKTFKHSGALGDIIYSLPTIKKLGGGILFLDTNGGSEDPYCQKQILDKTTKFNKLLFDFMYPLLKNQNYIEDVLIWNKEKVDFNLNKFRSVYGIPTRRSKTNNIVDLHLQAFDLDPIDENIGWLDCGDPIILDRKFVICRSPRMQSNYPWFHNNKFFFRDNAVFVGLEKEHDLFEWTFEIKIPYVKTNDALTLCKIIKGCETFIANSTFSLSLAIGLGSVKVIQELATNEPTTHFPNKKNMSYV